MNKDANGGFGPRKHRACHRKEVNAMTIEEFVQKLQEFTIADFHTKPDEEGDYCGLPQVHEVADDAANLLSSDGLFLEFENVKYLHEHGFSVRVGDSDSFGILTIVVEWELDGKTVYAVCG